jgi:hypothetical protein
MQLMLQPTVRLMLQQTLRDACGVRTFRTTTGRSWANVAGNAVNNAANAGNIQGNTAPNPRHNAEAQPPSVQANRAEGSQ